MQMHAGGWLVPTVEQNKFCLLRCQLKAKVGRVEERLLTHACNSVAMSSLHAYIVSRFNPYCEVVSADSEMSRSVPFQVAGDASMAKLKRTDPRTKPWGTPLSK